MSAAMSLTFWGVRGTLPTPRQENLRYGGNTACLEIRLPEGDVLFFDAGTGIWPAGCALEGELSRNDLTVSLFLTHFHWDHIQGFPHFTPLRRDHAAITVHGPAPATTLREILGRQMRAPYYPASLGGAPATMTMSEVGSEPIEIGNARVLPFALNHPQGATGYRVECGGAVIVYASDTEHGDADADETLRRHARGADILVFDAQYTPEEYAERTGWGHSTWVEGTRVAQDAGVKRLFLFHHDPSHTDAFMDGILAQARQRFEGTAIAQEGTTVLT